tara:strand:+ start:28046 stop:28480 length:435 start_codon:yes stop_codon:yes gene_type:complete
MMTGNGKSHNNQALKKKCSESFKEGLGHFYGTSTFYKPHPIISNYALYTDGVHYFIEYMGGRGAYWFTDKVFSELLLLQPEQPFMSIKLVVNPDSTAVITAGDGNGTELWKSEISYTDAYEGTWEFFFESNYNGTHTLMLPSER